VTEQHPSEDELVLHYYGELSPGARETIDAHLAGCVACSAARRALGDALDRVDAAGIPEPDAGFERRIWERVRPELPRPTAFRRWPRPLISTAAIAALFAAVLMTAFAWMALRPQGDGPGAAIAERPRPEDLDTRERVLLTALDDHFSQTEILLVELLHARPAEEAGWAFQRTTADGLVASNRLYRQTARQNGNLQLASMLEDLEHVLVEIAASPDTADRQDVDFLRARVEDDALLFKVRAVATDIRGRQERMFHLQ
jgi:hypothetical protein